MFVIIKMEAVNIVKTQIYGWLNIEVSNLNEIIIGSKTAPAAAGVEIP